jgi:hypothetical protein
MKSRTHLLRLGSFERLESRAMLAHAGLDHDQFRPTYEMRSEQPAGFISFGHSAPMERGDRGPGGFERQPRGGAAFQNVWSPDSRGGGRPFDGNLGGYDAQIIATSTITIVPVTPVIVFISIPTPLVVQSSFIAPPTSPSPASSLRSSPLAAPPNVSSSSFLSVEAPARTSIVGRSALDSLSLVSSLSLRRTENDATTADETDIPHPPADNDHASNVTSERNAKATATPAKNPEPAADNTDDSDLIELTAEDPLTRGKRKTVRSSPTALLVTTVRENPVIRQRLLNDKIQLQPSEIWRQDGASEEPVTPVNDDLIELLASDAASSAAVNSSRSTFESHPATQLEATLGYFQAPELAPEAFTPVEVQPAAIAAATLPPAAAK